MSSSFSPKGTFIWIICALFFAYEFLLRTVVGTFQAPIMQDLNLSPVSFALLSSSAYLIIYGLMQMPAGFLTDKFGLKKTLGFAVILSSLSSVLFALVYDFNIAMIVRLIMGLGSSFGFVCLLVAVYDWLPKNKTAFFIGLSQFIGTIGPMLAAGPLNALATNSNISWREVFFTLGIVGFGLSALVLIFVQNNNQDNKSFKIIEQARPIKQSLTNLWSQNQTWVIAFYSAFVYFTLEYLSENEGKAFIELNGFDGNFASYMISIGWLGYAIGCPLCGMVSDLLKRRKLVMQAAASLSLLSLATILFGPNTKSVVAPAFFLLGIGSGGQTVGFAIMAEQCSKYYTAVGLGFNNMVIGFISSVNAPILGYLLDWHKKDFILQVADYKFAFSYILFTLGIALVIVTFFIKETFCRSTKSFTFIED